MYKGIHHCKTNNNYSVFLKIIYINKYFFGNTSIYLKILLRHTLRDAIQKNIIFWESFPIGGGV